MSDPQEQRMTFREIVAIGFDKNGEADFRINMSIAEVGRLKMDELCRMMPWALKEALSLWLDHGPPSREKDQCAAQQSEKPITTDRVALGPHPDQPNHKDNE